MTGRVRLAAAVVLALALGVLVLPAVRGGSSGGLDILVDRGREPKQPLPLWASDGPEYDAASFAASIDAVSPEVPPRPVTNVPLAPADPARAGATPDGGPSDPEAPAEVAAATKWEMIGAIVGPEYRRAILRQDRSPRQVMVGEGETIEGGFEVVRIEDRRVVVRTGEGVEESLVLRGSAPPAGPASPDAVPSAAQQWNRRNSERLTIPPTPSTKQPRVVRDIKGNLVVPNAGGAKTLPPPDPNAPTEEPGEER